MSIDDSIDFEALTRRIAEEGARGPVSRIVVPEEASEDEASDVVLAASYDETQSEAISETLEDDAEVEVTSISAEDDVSLVDHLAENAEASVAALFSETVSWDESPAEPEPAPEVDPEFTVQDDDVVELAGEVAMHDESLDEAEASEELADDTILTDDNLHGEDRVLEAQDVHSSEDALRQAFIESSDDIEETEAPVFDASVDDDAVGTLADNDDETGIVDEEQPLDLTPFRSEEAAAVTTISASAVAADADEALPEISTRAPEAFPEGMSFEPEVRRPRICLMGEFSAGKSTLSNLLLGARSLPVNVTATQLPPVWISYGDRAPYRVDLEGAETPVDLNKIEDIPVEETSHIRIFRRAEILEMCDLIDMPGISDPNMSAEVWQRVLPKADAIVWCTHATQAWRQSEAAVWSMMDPDIQAKSLLLLTRMDKILTERDQRRVMHRVGKETAGLFRAQFGVSLIKALDAADDTDAWSESGADAFMDELVALIDEMSRDLQGSDHVAEVEAETHSTSLTQRPRNVAQMNDAGKVVAETMPEDAVASVSPARVVRPRPVAIDPSRRRTRPVSRGDSLTS